MIKHCSFIFILMMLTLHMFSLHSANTSVYSPVYEAVDQERADMLSFLLDHGEDPNKRNVTTGKVHHWYYDRFGNNAYRLDEVSQPGRSPLELAVEKNRVDLVRILLEHPSGNVANPEISRTYHKNIKNLNDGSFELLEPRIVVTSWPLSEAITCKKHKDIVDLLIKHYKSSDTLHDHFDQVRTSRDKNYMSSFLSHSYHLFHGVKSGPVPNDVIEIAINKLLANLYEYNKEFNQAKQLVNYGIRIDPHLVTKAWFDGRYNWFEVLINGNTSGKEVVKKLVEVPNAAQFILQLLKRGDINLQEVFQDAIKHDNLALIKLMTEISVNMDEFYLAVLYKAKEAQEHFAKVLNIADPDKKAFNYLCDSALKEVSPVAFAVAYCQRDLLKYLLKVGHNPNLRTASKPVYYWMSYYDQKWSMDKKNNQPGYTPLEIAIENHDVETVRILLEYLPSNAADPELQRCYQKNISGIYKDGYTRGNRNDKFITTAMFTTSRPLSDAISNKAIPEIVDMITRHYKSLDRLHESLNEIQESGSRDYIRSYLRASARLFNGEEPKKIDSTAIDTLLKHSISNLYDMNNYSSANTILQYGIPVPMSIVEKAWQERKHDWMVIFSKGNVNANEFINLLLPHKDGAQYILPLLDRSSVVKDEVFMSAVKFDNVTLVSSMIDIGFLPSKKHYFAAIEHQSSEVQQLLAKKEYIIKSSHLDFEYWYKLAIEAYSPVAFAVENERYDVLKVLLDKNFDPNKRDRPTESVYYGWTTGMSEHHTAQDPVGQPGFTPLELAVQVDNVEMVRILLEYNDKNHADPEIKRKYHPHVVRNLHGSGLWDDSRTVKTSWPLMNAIKDKRDSSIVHLLIMHYRTPQLLFDRAEEIRLSGNSEYMRSYLEKILSFQSGNSEVVDPEFIDLLMTMPLEYAYVADELALGSQMVNMGVSVPAKVVVNAWKDGKNDWFELLINGNINLQDTMKQLYYSGFSDAVLRVIEIKEINDKKSFNLAIQYNDPVAVQVMIAKGVVPQYTTFTYAIDKSASNVIALLVEGGYINAQQLSDGINYAYKKNKLDIIYLLLSYAGPDPA